MSTIDAWEPFANELCTIYCSDPYDEFVLRLGKAVADKNDEEIEHLTACIIVRLYARSMHARDRAVVEDLASRWGDLCRRASDEELGARITTVIESKGSPFVVTLSEDPEDGVYSLTLRSTEEELGALFRRMCD